MNAVGAFRPDTRELDDAVVGGRSEPARVSPDGTTVFKSVGLAVEDLAVARVAVDRLQARRG